MISTSDFKKGVRVLLEGHPYTIVDFNVQSPTARGSATLVRSKLRHILTGAMIDRTFKAGERLEQPDLEMRPVQFMYKEGDDFHFMDSQSYDQFQLGADQVGDAARWLIEDATLMSIHFNGAVAGIEMPQFVELDIAETEPAVRGDTASGRVMKEATLVTGAIVKVPLYMEAGERILVSTQTGEFVKRVASRE
jgi:elongation factor P